MLVSYPSGPDLPINPSYPALGTSRPECKHMRQGGRYQPRVEGLVVDRPDQRDDGAHQDAPEAGHSGEVHVGDLVQLEVEKRSKRLWLLWGGEVGPGGRAVFNRGWELSTPAASVVGLSLPCHGLTKTHPAGEDEGGEGTDKGAQLIAIGEEHAEHKSPEHRPSHDPKDAKSCLENAREVLDHENDAVADDAKTDSKELGDEGGLCFCQVDFTARLDEIPASKI